MRKSLEKEEEYYPDSDIRIVSPFFVCQCPEGHQYWGIFPTETCDMCGKKLNGCVPATEKQKKHPAGTDCFSIVHR